MGGVTAPEGEVGRRGVSSEALASPLKRLWLEAFESDACARDEDPEAGQMPLRAVREKA
jgi:hypothetical protein